jgi:hypothetical protein
MDWGLERREGEYPWTTARAYPTIETFLLTRLAEMQRAVADFPDGLAKSVAQQALEVQVHIVQFHQSWPVLVESPPELSTVVHDFDAQFNNVTYQMQQRIQWLTQEEYRRKFGSEPPTAPFLRAMAQQFRGHPDFDPEWAN